MIEKLKKECEEYQREIEELIERGFVIQILHSFLVIKISWNSLERKANKTLHQHDEQFDKQIDEYREQVRLLKEDVRQLQLELQYRGR